MRRLSYLFLLALIVRCIYLAYNESLALAPVWFSVVLTSLTAAEHLMGVPLTGLYDVVQSVNYFKHEIRGPGLLHMLEIALTGKSSLLHLSILGVLIDSMMLLVVYQLARRLSSEKLARTTALVYALSPIHIYMSVVPSWYTWLNAGALVVTLLTLRMLRASKLSEYVWLGAATSLVIIVIAQFRVTIAPIPMFLAGTLLLFSFFKYFFELKPNMRRTAVTLVIVGACGNLAYGIANKIITGEFFLGRKHIAHSFLMGMGETPNYYSQMNRLDGGDEPVYEMYWRANPNIPVEKNATITAFIDENYRTWTRAQAKDVMFNHTRLYIKLFVSRIIKILFPNFRIAFVADVDATARLEPACH
jgi:hypothetical protein